MLRPLLFLAILTGSFSPFWAQQQTSIGSEHVLLLLPPERESLGRELIADIERCYEFMNRATSGSLPRKILLTIDWDRPDSDCNPTAGAVTVGMNQPAAMADSKAFLLHSAGREIARLGLFEFSDGAEREDTEFLFEGMIEILVHEYDHSARKLEAAWAFSRLLDEMQILGLTEQRSWPKFSGGKRCLRNASPGITFLTTFRELQGRDRPLKLFEALRDKTLTESLVETFRAPAAELQETWLKKVREYPIPDEITTDEQTPQLLKTTLVPDAGKPGALLQLRFFIQDRARNLLSNSVFVKDERTGRLMPVQFASEKGAQFLVATIPVASDCPPGRYKYEVTAIDEAGNLRRWSGSYPVGS